jgi:hypothetical protein
VRYIPSVIAAVIAFGLGMAFRRALEDPARAETGSRDRNADAIRLIAGWVRDDYGADSLSCRNWR